MATALVVGAGNRARKSLAPYALDHPDELQIVGVAEPDESRRKPFAETYRIDDHYSFQDWQELVGKPRLADAAIISTQDSMHFGPAMKLLEKGYHLLLEKPMSNKRDECVLLAEASKRSDRVFTICHVLRYTPFFRTIKSIIEEGGIGELVTIQLTEAIGYWHFAHAYVRGNWNNLESSSPIILSKCSHDLDILLWLAGADCKSLASFGSLFYFSSRNAPSGVPEYCLEGCPVQDSCPFYAPSIYLDDQHEGRELSVSTRDDIESRRKALERGRYGRCVYRCDNNVVDHQTLSLEFVNDVTASFSLNGFTNENTRTIRISGTQGEIRGHLRKGDIEVRRFGAAGAENIEARGSGGHCGGDKGLMSDFISLVNNADYQPTQSMTSAEVSVQSHLMAFAAEDSRITGKAVDFPRFVEKLKEKQGGP